MPSVLDAPAYSEHSATHALTTRELPKERHSIHTARSSCWRTLLHGLTKAFTSTPRAQQAPLGSMRRLYEAPMDQCIREHPSLSILALALV
jgi:hypothetical protein